MLLVPTNKSVDPTLVVIVKMRPLTTNSCIDFIDFKQGIGELNTDYTDSKSQTTTKDEEKANIFADYFSSVFTTEQPGYIPTMGLCPQLTTKQKWVN